MRKARAPAPNPPWFASAYLVLNLDPSPSRCLAYNRFAQAKYPKFDRAGLSASLRRVLAWDIDCRCAAAPTRCTGRWPSRRYTMPGAGCWSQATERVTSMNANLPEGFGPILRRLPAAR